MRNWQLSASDPMSLTLAADVRQFQTDYADDQIWELELGAGQAPALSLTTRYGGRCGLARLVPMWVIDGRVVYEAEAYARPPVLHDFYPNYARLTAYAAPHLAVQIEAWAMESHAIGGRILFRNESRQPVEAGLDLFAQFMREQEPGDVNLLELSSGEVALHLKDVGNLQPVILLQGVNVSSGGSPKLAARVTLAPKQQAELCWVHAARPRMADSVALAHYWLTQVDWGPYLKELPKLNASVPVVKTGDDARDAAIAFSYRTLLGGLVGPTGRLPYPALIDARTSGHGFSTAGDGADYHRIWGGQDAFETWLLAPVLAQAAPDLAKGLIRNYVATAQPDGTIDARPGMAGQRAGVLCPPLLASTAWRIYEVTEDRAFLAEVFPALGRFFERWFSAAADRDADGLPEWDSSAQRGFLTSPTFAPYRRWSQNVDIRLAETPDLAAYLLREGRSLLAMADLLDKPKAEPVLRKRLAGLQTALDGLWDAETGEFHYRDRDAHLASSGDLLGEGPGDQPLLLERDLGPANRLVVRALGGRDLAPNFSVTLEGLDDSGQPVTEALGQDAFNWYRGLGAATTAHVYRHVARASAEGLSRVYTLQVSSVDWTRHDAALLLPLWAMPEDAERAAGLIRSLTDPARYWRPRGVPRCDARDPAYDPQGINGCGGVNLAWNSMLGEGLIEAGQPEQAAALFERLLAAQIEVLGHERAFREGYDSDAPGGLGERGGLAGIVPLDLLWRLLGIRIVSPRKVWIGGTYALPWPVTVSHHGVTIERDAKGAHITFLSGQEKRVRSARWRAIEDDSTAGVAVPKAKPFVARRPPEPPPPVPLRTSTVKVKVEDSPDHSDPFA